MQFMSFKWRGKPRLGVIRNGLVYPVEACGFDGHLLDLIDAGPHVLEGIGRTTGRLTSDQSVGTPADLTPLAVIPHPRRTIFCAGKTYRDHAIEYTRSGYDKKGAQEVPDEPVAFFKLAECVVSSGEAVDAQADVTQEMDYEAELAFVLKSGGRRLSRDQARDAIFGYFLVNDLTARDWQKGRDQWVVGKSFDGYFPMGSLIVTADEVSDLNQLRFECYVNGEKRQEGNPAELLFKPEALIEYFSRGITLIPGDIFSTGSPLGPGIGFNPPKFLRAGDSIMISSPLMGALETPVT
jgi:2-keto-4-pentenoate hydratase/2-oxohepta-3-ene-1,7-dioic acid hydratase in catechol pathway